MKREGREVRPSHLSMRLDALGGSQRSKGRIITATRPQCACAAESYCRPAQGSFSTVGATPGPVKLSSLPTEVRALILGTDDSPKAASTTKPVGALISVGCQTDTALLDALLDELLLRRRQASSTDPRTDPFQNESLSLDHPSMAFYQGSTIPASPDPGWEGATLELPQVLPLYNAGRESNDCAYACPAEADNRIGIAEARTTAGDQRTVYTCSEQQRRSPARTYAPLPRAATPDGILARSLSSSCGVSPHHKVVHEIRVSSSSGELPRRMVASPPQGSWTKEGRNSGRHPHVAGPACRPPSRPGEFSDWCAEVGAGLGAERRHCTAEHSNAKRPLPTLRKAQGYNRYRWNVQRTDTKPIRPAIGGLGIGWQESW